MPPPATANEFLDLVRKSGVLDETKFQEAYPDDSDLPADPRDCATALVKAGLLTPYQAGQMLAGKFRGFTLGPYKLLKPLGQGGMGVVYLAEHTELRRKVALKILPTDKALDKVNLERFLREARAAAALDHPNIVRIHDVCKQGQVRYLAMEFVEGETLETLLTKGGPMGLSRSVVYIAQAAAGLQHAYEKGFVHRDIKPGNLMLSQEGTVKILDMGLARSMVNPDDKLTEVLDEGAVVGTADFISPEQSMNAPGIDIRADIYSLGATFFALVTGRPPFGGNATQKLTQHQFKAPPSLTALDKTIPPRLAAVVERMLAKKPEDRFQTPADVIAALAEWLPDAGAARVVAGLSGSEQTEVMQAAMTGLVTGGTQRLGSKRRKKKQAAAAKKQKMVVMAAVGVAAVAALLVVVLALSGGKKEERSTADSGPSRAVPPPPAPPAGKAAAKAAAVPHDRSKDRADGLVGHWKFAAPVTTEAADESGSGGKATVVGTVDWAQLGDRAGLTFDGGGGLVRVPDHARLRFTRAESFTLAAWLKAPDELVGGRWQGVITKPFGRADGWYGIWLANHNGQPHWAFGSAFANDPQANLIGGRATGGWQHVCIVQDATLNTRRIYVDGRDATLGTPGRAKDCDGLGDLVIGGCVIHEANGAVIPEPFRGAISEVKLYSRALTADEISRAFQSE